MDSLDLPWRLIAVLLGPVIGSFIGLASLRMPERRPVAWARSACGHCGRTLSAADLVPLASFAMSGGACRSCAGPIPRRYPLVELACAGIAGWAALVHQGPLVMLSALLGWQLLLLALLDAEHLWLPRVLTLTLAGSGLVVALAAGVDRLIENLIGAAAGFLVIAAIGAAYRALRKHEGIGGGDAYLLAGAGAWVGWMSLPTVLVWASVGGLLAVGTNGLIRRRIDLDRPIPFGVFLALGTWLAWLYGPLGA